MAAAALRESNVMDLLGKGFAEYLCHAPYFRAFCLVDALVFSSLNLMRGLFF